MTSMQKNSFKWWYALIGYVGYQLALVVNTLFSSITGDLLEGESFNSGALFNGTMFVFAGLVCLLLIRVVSRARLTREEFGIHLKDLKRAILIGIIFGLLFFAFSELVEANNSSLKEGGEQVMDEFNLGQNIINDLLLILSVGLLAPVVEEIVFRGAIFNSIVQGLKKCPNIPKWLPLLAGLMVSALAFMSIHGGGGQDAQLGLLGLLGVLAALAMYFTKSLFAAIFTHAVNNNIVLLYAFMQQDSMDTNHRMILVSGSIICLIISIPVGLLFGRLLPSRR